MPGPVAPYCTTSDVALLNISQLGGLTDFIDQPGPTTPTLARVTSLITFVSAHIDSQLVSAGYIVPLVEVSGEAWPTHQTTYFKMLCAIGTAAKAFGEVMAPAPYLERGGARVPGNIFEEQFKLEMKRLYNMQGDRTSVRLRANWRPGTPAEVVMKLAAGPTTDFEVGRMDPTDTLPFQEVTDIVFGIQANLSKLRIPWDYMTDLDMTDTSLGATVEENLWR